ncbi:MAG: hypothetical protein EPN97_17970 [Alphaproteobacteria bacterium]|nr:MAG: hypothetical protein EPN97_17970 [Alphaproteobacteria bacterium]
MPAGQKNWRTAAYRVETNGQEHVMFWVMHQSGLDPEKSFVTEYDLYKGGSTSKPVADHMSHDYAFRLVAELDRQAAEKFPCAGDEAFSHPSVNWHREDMAPWQENPAYQQGIKDEALRRLKARKPPGFGLK